MKTTSEEVKEIDNDILYVHPQPSKVEDMEELDSYIEEATKGLEGLEYIYNNEITDSEVHSIENNTKSIIDSADHTEGSQVKMNLEEDTLGKEKNMTDNLYLRV